MYKITAKRFGEIKFTNNYDQQPKVCGSKMNDIGQKGSTSISKRKSVILLRFLQESTTTKIQALAKTKTIQKERKNTGKTKSGLLLPNKNNALPQKPICTLIALIQRYPSYHNCITWSLFTVYNKDLHSSLNYRGVSKPNLHTNLLYYECNQSE